MNYQKKLAKASTKKRLFTVSTGGTTRGMTLIKGIRATIPAEPTIVFSQEAFAQMQYIVDKCPKEVGWFTLNKFDEATNTFFIYKVVLPEQEVTPVETAIGGDEWAAASYELITQGHDTTEMYGWFHSHVNMGVSPSGQDEAQVEDFLEDLIESPEVPAFIRGIMNKKGDIKLDVYFQHSGVAYSNVPYRVDQPAEWTAGLDALIKERVKEPKYRVPTYPTMGGGSWQAKKPQPVTRPNPLQQDLEWDEFGTGTHSSGLREPDYLYPEDHLENIHAGFPDDEEEVYGRDWDESDHWSVRPEDWEWDPTYLSEGYPNDVFAYLADQAHEQGYVESLT